MYKKLYIFIVILRIVLPFSILKYPLFGIVVSIFLDIVDVEFASRRVLTLKQYETADKVLDTWWYFFALVYARFFLPGFFGILLSLFIYRLIGTIVFFYTRERKILFFFPALFENVFFLFFFSVYFKKLNFLLKGSNFYFSLFAVCLIKLVQEWWVHTAQISIPEDIFKKRREWIKEK